MSEFGNISAADWGKGIALSVLASVIGGASKLAIRKSWLLVADDIDDNEDLNEDSPGSLTLDTRSVISGEENFPVASLNENPGPQRKRKNCIAYLLRCGGMIGMSILNPICCVLAMKYASPSILAPFSGLTMVWVILFSNLVVGEIPTTAQKVASALIISGEVIVATFGDHTNEVNMTPHDVVESYKDPYFIAYFVAVFCYMLLLCYWINFSSSPVLRRYAWGSCGGTMTGLQNFLKDSLTLLRVSDSFTWLLPFFVFMAAASAFGGLLVLTVCMKRYDATYSAASFVGSFVVSASIMSAFHYHTFAVLDNTVNYVMYPFGLVVLMFGVYILVRGSDKAGDDVIGEDVEPVVRDRTNSDDSQIPFMYAKVEDDSLLIEGGQEG